MTTSLSPKYENVTLKTDEDVVYDIPRQVAEGIYDIPRKTTTYLHYQNDLIFPIYQNVTALQQVKSALELASRSLPPLPDQPERDLDPVESIYEALNFPLRKSADPLEPADQANKLIQLFEKLHNLLRGLEKTLSKILHPNVNKSVSAEKTDRTPPTLTSEAQKTLAIAEFRFESTNSPAVLQALRTSLDAMKFFLEGQIKSSIKIYESERGDELGAKLTKHMGFFKYELACVETRLQEVIDMQSKLTSSIENPIYESSKSSTAQAKISTVNGSSFFKSEKASVHYENGDVLKSFVSSR